MSSTGRAILDELLQKMRRSAANHLGDQEAGFADIAHTLECLEDELELILREHAGMAEDLLRTYEQLGIVFEMTRILPQVGCQEEVIRQFVAALANAYGDEQVCWAHHDVDELLVWQQPLMDDVHRTREVIDECISGRQVVFQVFDPPLENTMEMIAAPVYSGDRFICVIVLSHDRGVRQFQSSDMNLLETLVLFCGDILRNYLLLSEVRSLSINMVKALVSAVDQKDEYTSGHSSRVGFYAKMLAERYGLEGDDLQMLHWAALLHDVGKIGIRDDVLKKEGKLTAEEFDHMKTHPVRSYEVVKGVPQLHKALDGVRHHHERFDGTGYPDKLRGAGIPLQARIILVADIFDALTTNRSYRAAFSWEKSLAILEEESGTVGDPQLVALFVPMMRAAIQRGEVVIDANASLAHAPQTVPPPPLPPLCSREETQ